MTTQELGRKIKTKYSQYNKIPDFQLGIKVLEKYPQYKKQINKEEIYSLDLPSVSLQQMGAKQRLTKKYGLAGKALGTVGEVLGIEKAGRRIGTTLAQISSEHRKTLSSIEEAEEKGFIAKGTTQTLKTGGVSGKEFAGSLALVGLNLALPFMGKLLHPAKAALPSLMGRSAALGAGFGGAGALAEEKNVGKGMLIGAGIGASIPMAVAFGKYVASRTPKLLGIITGERHEAIMAGLRNPRQADIGIRGGDKALREAIREGADKSVKLKSAFIKGHSQSFNKLASSQKGQIISKKVIVKEFETLLKNKRVRVLRGGKLDFTLSDIATNPGEVAKIKTAYQAMRKWNNFTLSGTHELKQMVGKLTKFPTEVGGTSKSPVLGMTYHKLDEAIKISLPTAKRQAYIALNKKFSNNIGFYDDLVQAFTKGDPFTRLAGAIGDNKDSLRQVLEFYKKKTGNDIVAIVGGRIMSAEKPAAFGFLNPRSWVDFFLSPETQAGIATRTGKMMIGKEKLLGTKLPQGLGRVGAEMTKGARQLVYPAISKMR